MKIEEIEKKLEEGKSIIEQTIAFYVDKEKEEKEMNIISLLQGQKLAYVHIIDWLRSNKKNDE